MRPLCHSQQLYLNLHTAKFYGRIPSNQLHRHRSQPSTMQASTIASNSAPRRQERLDVTSQFVGAGSSYDSSDDELELEDPVVTAERQQQRSQRLDAFVGSDGPWSVYNQRRQSEATAQAMMAERMRAFEQQFSPSRRSTSP